MAASPLEPHAATPGELRERLRLEQRGAAFLVLRDAEARQVLVEMPPDAERLTVGRSTACDVPVHWDARASRAHATLERVGGVWTLVDDGLSRNGTWVNGERVTGRRRLDDGDVIVVGATAIAFCAGGGAASGSGATLTGTGPAGAGTLTPAQRRVLVALCRPYRDGGPAAPASNPAIAGELSVSVDAVKTTMRALFDVFGIADLPQNEKRAALAAQALRSGAVTRRDLAAGPP